jgi:hypothetical protein
MQQERGWFKAKLDVFAGLSQFTNCGRLPRYFLAPYHAPALAALCLHACQSDLGLQATYSTKLPKMKRTRARLHLLPSVSPPGF